MRFLKSIPTLILLALFTSITQAISLQIENGYTTKDECYSEYGFYLINIIPHSGDRVIYAIDSRGDKSTNIPTELLEYAVYVEYYRYEEDRHPIGLYGINKILQNDGKLIIDPINKTINFMSLDGLLKKISS